jgi:thiamine-phosphate pyrophosphorylase
MVTDSRLYGRGDGMQSELFDAVAEAAARAARAGVDLVQIRERTLDAASLLELLRRVRDVVEETGPRVLVNDRVDVAIAGAADGVHLPSAAPSCARVRAIVPDGFLIGRSVHSEAEAIAAAAAGGCDYLIFGTVYESRSKPAGHPVAGIDALARVCHAVGLPVLAIGGITVERIPEVVAAGAAGVAAIGLFGHGTEAELVAIVARLRNAFAQS